MYVLSTRVVRFGLVSVVEKRRRGSAKLYTVYIKMIVHLLIIFNLGNDESRRNHIHTTGSVGTPVGFYFDKVPPGGAGAVLGRKFVLMVRGKKKSANCSQKH